MNTPPPLASSPLAVDVTLWMRNRCRALSGPTSPIAWSLVAAEFGSASSASALPAFQEAFEKALALAMRAEPSLRADCEVAGLVLHPLRSEAAGV